MNPEFARKRELITWLITCVPEKYLPPPIREMIINAGCGSTDCVDEVIAAYVDGKATFDGLYFRTMPVSEIFDHAQRLKDERRAEERADPKRTTIHDEAHGEMMRQIKQMQADIAELQRH